MDAVSLNGYVYIHSYFTLLLESLPFATKAASTGKKLLFALLCFLFFNLKQHPLLYPGCNTLPLICLVDTSNVLFPEELTENVCFAYKNLTNKTEHVRKQYCTDTQIRMTAPQWLFSQWVSVKEGPPRYTPILKKTSHCHWTSK